MEVDRELLCGIKALNMQWKGLEYYSLIRACGVNAIACRSHANFFVMPSLAIASSTSLFAALIVVDGISCDSGSSGDGKLVVMKKKLYNT